MPANPFKMISELLGGGEKKTSNQSSEDISAEQRKANKGRSALYETAGGVAGSELDPEQVKRRNTLLGN